MEIRQKKTASKWVVGVLIALFTNSLIADSVQPDEILKSIDQRDRGSDLEWTIRMTLTDRSGNERVRTGKILRKNESGDADRSEQITVFLTPENIRHTALLSIDSAEKDTLWLYLPALKKTKRVPPADRGSQFVGTDFTMEDVKIGFEYEDFSATILGEEEIEGIEYVQLRVEPRTDDLKSALGYDYSIVTVRTDIYYRIEQKFYRNEELIKENFARKIEKVDGIWTALEIEAVDLINQHRTVIFIEEAKYNINLSAGLFKKSTLNAEKIR